MDVPEKIKRVIEKRLIKISRNNFSQDTIKLLLIELREYLPKKSILKELANFVAHPKRDRGIVLETVNYAYNRSRVLFRQLEGNKTGRGLELDISFIPEDIYQVVTWHFSKIKPDIKKLKKFKKSFRYCEKKQAYCPKCRIKHEIIKFIEEAISIISLRPAITQSDIINELVKCIDNIGLNSYKESIVFFQDSIIACMLTMLHQSYFILKDGNIAKAYLYNDPIVTDLNVKVGLLGVVTTHLSSSSIAFPLISSEVTVAKYFSESMFDLNSPFPKTDYSEEDYLEAVRNKDGSLVIVKMDK